MKVFVVLLALSCSLLNVFASEDVNTSDKESEYPLIKPIAVEEAPPEVVLPIVVEVLDSDNDGVADAQDRCPNTQINQEVDKYGCLIKHDSDHDGVADEKDECPNTQKGLVVDYRGCEVDSDDDGVVDSQDKCPNTLEGFTVDGYGCPQTATLSVHFGSNKYDITTDVINDLQSFALFLRQNKGYKVVIYGYTDSMVDAQHNQVLSQNRANSVREVLIRYGIDPERLVAIGRGEARPVASNATKEGRAKNRRIEVELVQG